MIEHLSVHGKLNPRRGLHCLWCPNNTSTPLVGTFVAIKIIKNEIVLRKLWPPK
jgi:hypothetical protein